MRFLLPIMIVGLLLVGGSGLFILQKKVASGDLAMPSASDTALGSALSIVVENATGQVTVKTEGDITGFVPAAPEGWTVRPYEIADGTVLTGKEIIRSTVSKSTTNSILLSFARDAGRGEEAEVVTYENGDRKVALRLRLLETYNERTLQGGMMAAISDSLSAQSFGGFSSGSGLTRGLFAKLDGIEIIEKPQYSQVTSSNDKIPVLYRTFDAKVGPYVEVQVLTNAADADVAAILSQIDMKTLNEMLPDAAPEYRAGVGWQVASTEPLDTTPPPPSLAYKAYQVLNDGRIHSAYESDIMSQMVRGNVVDWSTVRDMATPTDKIIGLLGPEPDSRKLKRMAAALKEQEDVPYAMRNLLNGIERGQITSQAQLYAAREFRELTITPEFRAIMGMLPVGEVNDAMLEPDEPAVEEPQAMANTAPVIRRGVTVASGMTATTCTIELGVRRCVVGEANPD